MNITFNDLDVKNTGSFVNVSGSGATSNGFGGSVNKISSAAELTKGIDIENNAYKDKKKSANDVMISAASEAMNLDAQRDYMTVMSNCVSTKDFSKMQKDGFDPSNMEIDEVVTIVDHIKAAMIAGGADITGYTDTISDEALVNITGSKSYANELKNAAANKDIPLTKDNAEDIQEGFNELSKVGELSEAGVKYMVENDLTPTTSNLYTAAFSAGNSAGSQGRGYYAAGEVAGYYAKKPESIDLDSLMPQIEKTVSEAGYEINDENIDAAIWLIEKGIPLTTKTYDRYQNVNSVSLPMEYAEYVDHASDAISDGIRVKDADLSRKISLRQEAAAIYDEVETLGTIKGRRVLEEVRLSMTVEANLKLLRSGYAIDTAPMEELVDNLREIEKEFAINLTNDENEIEAVRKKNIYEDTLSVVSTIKSAPISISIRYESGDELIRVGQRAQSLTADYSKAMQSYETLMTAPRTDLGDNIQSAFRNVDDILSEMGLPLTEENRRAVRILGYNSMDINEENIESVSDKDTLLRRTLNQLTPGRVLTMIRDGKNPMMMSVSELNEYLSQIDTTKEDMLSYSKFLYKLEQSKDITEDERSAYIGIYRLVNQIEKSENLSVGIIEESNQSFNFENILRGLRSRKNKNLDYRVDDSFGGVDIIDRGIESITTQIAKGYVQDVDDLIRIIDEVGDNEADTLYDKLQYDEVRESFNIEAEVLEQLMNMSTSPTAANINDMSVMMNAPATVFDRLKDIGYRRNKDIDLSSREKAQESYREFTGSVKDFLMNDVFGTYEDIEKLKSMDVKLRMDLYQHMDFLDSQSGEENYEIPTEINGELTAINLKVITGKNDDQSVSISFESTTYGKVAAQISLSDHGWSGYCSCSNKEGTELLNNGKDTLINELGRVGIELKEISFIETRNLNLNSFNNNITKDRKADTDVISTDRLYQAAKAFIGYVEGAAR